VRVGDLVKTVRGYSEPGIVTKIWGPERLGWVTVHWPDYGISIERREVLVVIS